MWAFRAWRVAHKWFPPPLTKPLDDDFLADHSPFESTAAIAIYFELMEDHLGDHVAEALRLMNWPIPLEGLGGVIQLAAASACAAMHAYSAQQMQHEQDQLAAEKRAEAMASQLLAEEEAQATSKASKKSQQVQNQRASSRAAKTKSANKRRQQQQQQASNSKRGSSDDSTAQSSDEPTQVSKPEHQQPLQEQQQALSSHQSIPDGDAAHTANKPASDTCLAEAAPSAGSDKASSLLLAGSQMPDNAAAASCAARLAGASNAAANPHTSSNTCTSDFASCSASRQEQLPAQAFCRGACQDQADPRQAACAIFHSSDPPAMQPHMYLPGQSLSGSRQADPQQAPRGAAAAELGTGMVLERAPKHSRSPGHCSPAVEEVCSSHQLSQSHAVSRKTISLQASAVQALADVTASSLNISSDAQELRCWDEEEQAVQLCSVLRDRMAHDDWAGLGVASQRAVKYLGRAGISNPMASQVFL